MWKTLALVGALQVCRTVVPGGVALRPRFPGVSQWVSREKWRLAEWVCAGGGGVSV